MIRAREIDMTLDQLAHWELIHGSVEEAISRTCCTNCFGTANGKHSIIFAAFQDGTVKWWHEEHCSRLPL